MNIVVSTEHNQLLRQLYAAVDAAISNRYLQGMELYTFRSLTPEEFVREAVGSSAGLWLMFFDSNSRPNWLDVLNRLTSFSSQTVVYIVGSDYDTAARLVDGRPVRGVAGYIHPVHDNLERSCLNILTYLNHCVTSADGFLVVHGSNRGTWLSFSSIYYIETVKGTYMYSIHCSDGVCTFHSGIKELPEKLKPLFHQVRVPTTANLLNIRSFESTRGVLSFTGGISCCCSCNCRHDIPDYSRRHPCHMYAGGDVVERGPGRRESGRERTRQWKDYLKHIGWTLYAEYIKRTKFPTSVPSFRIYL